MTQRLSFIFLLVIVSVFFCSCKHEIHVYGTIADATTKKALQGVMVRTIVDGDAGGLEFVQSRTGKDGRFEMRFSSAGLITDSISLELSKTGYLTNIYTWHKDHPEDSFFMVRVP